MNGNTLTQDKVVRREFRLSEGDAFNSIGVARTTARINSLGFFQENFEVNQVEGSAPDRIILEANVEEQPTGELQFSAGFSSMHTTRSPRTSATPNRSGSGTSTHPRPGRCQSPSAWARPPD